jgi:DNA-binding LytR/AlgR family response regulator
MQQQKYIVIDDDVSTICKLTDSINQLSFMTNIGVFENVNSAFDTLISKQVDIIFLGIDATRVNPEVIDFLTYFQNMPSVIILSNTPEFAVESYRIGKCVDYLLKPLAFERLLIAINRAIKSNPAEYVSNKTIFLKMGRYRQKFEIDSIDYFEAYGIYVKVYAEGAVYIVNDILSSIIRMIDEKQFMRVHKSFVINTKKISRFSANNVYIGNKKIPLGATFKSTFEIFVKSYEVTAKNMLIEA